MGILHRWIHQFMPNRRTPGTGRPADLPADRPASGVPASACLLAPAAGPAAGGASDPATGGGAPDPVTGGPHRAHLRRRLAALLLVALLGWVLGMAPGGASPSVRAAQVAWTARTAASRAAVQLPRPGWEQLAAGPVQVIYPAGHQEGALWVRDYALASLPRVAQVTGLPLPDQPAVFVVHASPADLARSFGWDPQDPPLGFYAAGVIHVADPLTWAGERETFMRLGPVPHELAHWLLDRAALGNYPAWFTEGLAQAVDRELTGFTFGWAGRCPPVAWDDLNGAFASLPTDDAYGAALCLYDRLAAQAGPGHLAQLARELAAGRPFAAAARQVYGVEPARLLPGAPGS
ncbi:hypothetical protein [Thermaerobacter subterraneus]|uniref:Peptidase MA-like domain-containing protein n=1 Tax=Thermaerobacter subterraneus DSM 13965 TaxID=867903 RepID=K6QDL3_9FIRM|nr:hypothetical protein [Thermaerobacter subterraneus]EKP94796.1 hypothetical protein ThesuDRAFT_00502 [Thermaerobacter subterraneus DSM 13965]